MPTHQGDAAASVTIGSAVPGLVSVRMDLEAATKFHSGSHSELTNIAQVSGRAETSIRPAGTPIHLMMTRAEQLMSERGCPKVNLQVRHGNESAVEFDR